MDFAFFGFVVFAIIIKRELIGTENCKPCTLITIDYIVGKDVGDEVSKDFEKDQSSYQIISESISVDDLSFAVDFNFVRAVAEVKEVIDHVTVLSDIKDYYQLSGGVDLVSIAVSDAELVFKPSEISTGNRDWYLDFINFAVVIINLNSILISYCYRTVDNLVDDYLVFLNIIRASFVDNDS